MEQQQKDAYVPREYISKIMSQSSMIKVRLLPGLVTRVIEGL